MGLFSKKKQTIGYKYYLGMHMILARMVDAVKRIDVGDQCIWSGSCAGGRISVNCPDVFGGDRSEGGIVGDMDIEIGNPTQVANDYLQAQLGAQIPAWRGITGVVLRQMYLGVSPYLKKWAFLCQRIPNGWYTEKATIGPDANPAHIIYELLTNQDYGMAYQTADIDDASFTAAANTLFTENFGLSLLWDKSSSIESVLKEILAHIDAALYIDRTTGRFAIKLIRPDYNIESLTTLDESNISEVVSYARRTNADLINTLTIKYWDRDTCKDGSTTVVNTAMVYQMGGTVASEKKYSSITSYSLANSVAWRDLLTLSSPLATAQITATRAAAKLNVGDPFVFVWERYGISQMVMRITSIEFGKAGSSQVKIAAVEDVFSTAQSVFDAVPSSIWVNPINNPAPCPVIAAFEAPYYYLALLLGDDISGLAVDKGYVVATGTRPSNDALNAEMWVNSGVQYKLKDSETPFCPTAVLAEDIGITNTVLAIEWSADYALVAAGQWALIDNEIVRIDSATLSSITVGRGCLDTAPTTHNTASFVLIIGDFLGVDTTDYAAGATVNIKLLPVTSLGALAIADATAQPVTLDSRASRPYLPAKVRINDQADPKICFGAMVITWVHRNRLTQVDPDADIVDTEDASIDPETGTTYSWELHRASNGVLLDSGSALSGTTATAGPLATDEDVILTLWSVVGALVSRQTQTRLFEALRTEPRGTEDAADLRVTEAGEYRIIE